MGGRGVTASDKTGGWPGVLLAASGLGWGQARERRAGGLPEGRGLGRHGTGWGAGATGSPGGCNWEGGNHRGPLGVGPAGGGEVRLEAVASAPSRSNCGWCNRQRPRRERGLGRGEGASGPEPPPQDRGKEGGRGSASFSSSPLKKEKHSFLEGASAGGSKLRPYALGPQHPRASVFPSEQSAGGTPGTLLGS